MGKQRSKRGANVKRPAGRPSTDIKNDAALQYVSISPKFKFKFPLGAPDHVFRTFFRFQCMKGLTPKEAIVKAGATCSWSRRGQASRFASPARQELRGLGRRGIHEHDACIGAISFARRPSIDRGGPGCGARGNGVHNPSKHVGDVWRSSIQF